MKRLPLAGIVLLAMLAGRVLMAQAPTASPDPDSVRGRALARLLTDASVRNRLPADLMAYRADVETEVATLFRREDGSEIVTSLEQVASTLRWTRAGTYEQRVGGYRAQQVGLTMSMLSLFQAGWINPVLYGNRLRVRTIESTPDSARRTSDSTARQRARKRKAMSTSDSVRKEKQAARNAARDTLPIVHPLADDRDRFYTYTGGDTLVTIQTSDRRIPIVRVHVHPRAVISAPVALFVGDIDLDASRGTLVRLRGYFVRRDFGRAARLVTKLADAIAFVEYENSEREGQYWLPTMQRIELQVSAPMLGEGRAVIRIVSRFPAMAINDTTLDSLTLVRADSLRRLARRRLTHAPGDSVSAFRSWRYPFGKITSGLTADDFDDVGPDRLRPTGAPRLDLSAGRAGDVLHFNRIEGVYSGLGLRLRLRDAAPGVTMRANAGWAWSEHTTRGRVSIERERRTWSVGVRSGRVLDLTNDFRNAADSGSSFIEALAGTSDPYDYVDRRSTVLFASRPLGTTFLLRGEFGAVDDRYAATTVSRKSGSAMVSRPNRGVDEGGYQRTQLTLEWHPGVNAEFARPGVAARALYQRGDGSLNFQRAELRALARSLFGPFTLLAHLDAGQLWADRPPPQQLFEVGGTEGLPGYRYKTFAGTQAAVLRTQLMYTSPLLRRPLRLPWHWWFPALAPGLAIGAQSSWTGAPDEAARAAIRRLGTTQDSAGVQTPLSRTTGNMRATVNAGFHLFGGSIFLGWARPIDHRAGWRFTLGSGALL